MELFDKAGIQQLRNASRENVQLIYDALADLPNIQIITPVNPDERGCQLSLMVKKDGRVLFDHLTKQGIIADWREPDVIRIASTPLYTTREDVNQFISLVQSFNPY
jgi:kynureninase